MIVTLRNMTASDLGIGSGLVVPAMGEARVTVEQWKRAQNSRVVQGWLNAGKLIPHMETKEPTEPQAHLKEVVARNPDDFSEPYPEPESRERLWARAEALGIHPSPRWRNETLRRKIAEAPGPTAEVRTFTEAVSAPQTAAVADGAFHSVEPVKRVTRKRGRPRKAKS